MNRGNAALTRTVDLDIEEANRHSAEVTPLTMCKDGIAGFECITVICACGEAWRSNEPVGTVADESEAFENWEDHVFDAVRAVPGGAEAIAAYTQAAAEELSAMYDDIVDYFRWQYETSLELLGRDPFDGTPEEQGQWRAQVFRGWSDQYDTEAATLARLDPDNENKEA